MVEEKLTTNINSINTRITRADIRSSSCSPSKEPRHALPSVGRVSDAEGTRKRNQIRSGRTKDEEDPEPGGRTIPEGESAVLMASHAIAGVTATIEACADLFGVPVSP